MFLINKLAQLRTHRMTEAERTIAEELVYTEAEKQHHLDDRWEEAIMNAQLESRCDYDRWH